MKVTLNGQSFDMGNGRYSAFACEVARDAFRLFGIEQGICAAIGMAAASDLGRLNTHASVSISKANKDGKVTVREVGKIKGVTMTHSLAFVRCISLLNELEYIDKVNAVLCDSLAEWAKELKPVEAMKDEKKDENVPQNA